MAGHFRRRSAGALLAAALAGALLGGCGLPSDPQAPPRPPTAPTASTTTHRFSFSQPAEPVADAVRFGYEIYYKFWALGAFTDRNLRDLAALRRRGFVRLADASKLDPVDQADRPLILIKVATGSHTITLDFSPLRYGGDPVATGGSISEISLRRGVERTDGSYETFTCDRFLARHADVEGLKQLVDDCAGEPFQLELYALSYSRDDYGRERYSEARYLGSIVLVLP